MIHPSTEKELASGLAEGGLLTVLIGGLQRTHKVSGFLFSRAAKTPECDTDNKIIHCQTIMCVAFLSSPTPAMKAVFSGRHIVICWKSQFAKKHSQNPQSPLY